MKFECQVINIRPISNNNYSYIFTTKDNIPGTRRLNCNAIDIRNDVSTTKVFTGVFKYKEVLDYMPYVVDARFVSYVKEDKKIEYYIASSCYINFDKEDNKLSVLKKIMSEKRLETCLNVYPDFFDRAINKKEIDIKRLKNIGPAVMTSIKKKLFIYYYINKINLFLNPYNLSITNVKELYGEYDEFRLANMIFNKPFLLTTFSSIPFNIIDNYLKKLYPVSYTGEERYSAVALYVLNNIALNEGNTVVTKEYLLKACEKYELDEAFKDYLNTNTDTIYTKDEYIGLKKFYDMEKEIMHMLHEIDNAEFISPIINLNAQQEVESKYGYKLTSEQESVLTSVKKHNVMFIAGVAGTGKTFVTDAICHQYKQYAIALCSLSAQASSNLYNTTGISSNTIHKLLEFNGKKFKHNAKRKLPYYIIIVDEGATVNIVIWHALLSAIPLGAKLIILGDDGQLNAIGPGNLFKDMLEYTFHLTRLTQIHRQAKDSGIISDAIQIREGKNPIKGCTDKVTNGVLKDLHYELIPSNKTKHNRVIRAYMKAKKMFGMDNVIIITPAKVNGINSSNNINKKIQSLVYKNANTRHVNDKGFKFFMKTKVRQIENDDVKNVINGLTGYVVDMDDNKLVVNFNGVIVNYYGNDINNLSLGYASTIHSYQGTQAKMAIIVIDNSRESQFLCTREMIYTGITRAKDLGFIITDNVIFEESIRKTENIRTTFINKQLI